MGGSIILENCSRSGRSNAAGRLGPNWRHASMAVELFSCRHEGVSEEAEVCAILHLFRKEITGVTDACDVEDGYGLVCLKLADVIFAEVQMFHSFCCCCFRPVDAATLVIEDGSCVCCVFEGEVLCAETE